MCVDILVSGHAEEVRAVRIHPLKEKQAEAISSSVAGFVSLPTRYGKPVIFAALSIFSNSYTYLIICPEHCCTSSVDQFSNRNIWLARISEEQN